MATIKNSITMQDRVSPVLSKMAKAMQSNLKLMEQMNKASNQGISAKAFKRAQNDINAATNSLKKFQNDLIKSRQESDKLGNSISNIKNSAGNGLMNIYAGIGLAKQMGSLVSSSASYLDNMTLIKSRLDMINDGTQTTLELQDKILASANRARASYEDMSKAVTQLNMLAGEQFASNDEAIAFAETLHKMFAVSGTAGQEASAAMYQLNQALAAGKLQGDEFRSITENAPMLAEAIAKEMGKSKGELRELSSEGLITADIIKNAMFNAADDINKKFETIPMTFGQKMTIVKNNLMKQMEPVAKKFNDWLNSERGEKFFNALTNGVVGLANIAMNALDIISRGIAWIQDNIQYLIPFIVAIGVAMVGSATMSAAAWMLAHLPLLLIGAAIGTIIMLVLNMGYTFSDILNWIADKVKMVIEVIKFLMPVILAVGVAILVYWLGSFLVTAYNFITMIPAIIAQLWAMLPPLIAQLIGWLALNWPILLVAVAIGIVVFMLAQLGITFEQVVGFIVGLLFSLYAIVYNIVIGIINRFIIFATFLENLFINPIGAIKMLFLDMATYIIDKVMWVAKALQDLLNLILPVEVTIVGGLERIKSKIEETKAEIKEETGVKSAKQLEYKDIGAEFQKGYTKGSNFINNFGKNLSGFKDIFDKNKFKNPGISIPNASSFAKPSTPATKLDGGKVDEIGKIKDEVSITDEDIKLLKDIAATKFINKYTTLRPEMKVEFTGDIKETADINKILEAIEDMAEQAMANTIIEEAM